MHRTASLFDHLVGAREQEARSKSLSIVIDGTFSNFVVHGDVFSLFELVI